MNQGGPGLLHNVTSLSPGLGGGLIDRVPRGAKFDKGGQNLIKGS